MEVKKSKNADLENKKGIFIQVGLVVALSIILIGFEWTSKPDSGDDTEMVQQIEMENEMIVTRRQEPPKEQPKPETPKVAEVLDIVEDDVEIDDFDFDMEVDDDTEYDFTMVDDDEEQIDEEEIFYIVEDMPTFNGGEPAIEFRKYIAANLEYPEIAAENGISGRVIVQFAVNARGKVVDAVVVRSVDPALDKEAIRVVMTSPPWSPGKQRGKAVKVLFTFPINFVLQ
ncbi:MAG: energy transducer TonB [Bacteroidales bacterium]|nr:energy transducer TonB [Bacteroidales bacterium]MDT8431634.1 energy transducer TonB [Bacteroidales bacterium]